MTIRSDTFPCTPRRSTAARDVPPPVAIDTLDQAERRALCLLITSPAAMTTGGYMAGGSVIAIRLMQRLISDRLVTIATPDLGTRIYHAALTPRGRMYAAACLQAVPADVPSRLHPITK
jgi:hypothetical protein